MRKDFKYNKSMKYCGFKHTIKKIKWNYTQVIFKDSDLDEIKI